MQCHVISNNQKKNFNELDKYIIFEEIIGIFISGILKFFECMYMFIRSIVIICLSNLIYLNK